MNTHHYTEQDVVELIGHDLDFPGKLASLINENGDVRGYLVKALNEQLKREAERQQELLEEESERQYGEMTPAMAWALGMYGYGSKEWEMSQNRGV